MNSDTSVTAAVPLISSPSCQTPSQVQHKYGTRKRQNSIMRPSVRLRECTSTTPLTLPIQHRRIKPLGSLTPNTNTPPLLKTRIEKEEKDREANPRSRVERHIDFPPKHVVLHPDDASSKVFIAIGRALSSVNNCAMTVKDLAEVSLKFGLVCQNVSAAAQAITSFIRNHLHRCEVEQDFPLLLRHVLSGTSRDDSLVPALHSRSGGNVGKDKPKDAGKPQDGGEDDENRGSDGDAGRLTWFRRGTTVWYLSKAAGAPCPFARNGIALRDYAGVPAIGEGRRTTSSLAVKEGEIGSSCHSGMKRKREREGLRRRSVHGAAGGNDRREEEEEEDVSAGRKPTKVKLTLRLKPSPSSMREKLEESTSSDSDDEGDEDSMSVDSSSPPRLRTPAHCPQQRVTGTEQEWLPPYPIQRRISIPPYTPCETAFPAHAAYTLPNPTTNWTDFTSISYRRATSVPASVATPPPDSEEDDDYHITMTRNNEYNIERELGCEWEESTEETDGTCSPEREVPSETMVSPVIVKTEEEAVGSGMRSMLELWDRMDFSGPGSGSAVHVKAEVDDGCVPDIPRYDARFKLRADEVKLEEPDFDTLSFDVGSPDSDWPDVMDGVWRSRSPEDVSLSLDDLHIKQELEDDMRLEMSQNNEVAASPNFHSSSTGASGARNTEVDLVWKDVELLGPDSVLPQEFEEGEWERDTIKYVSQPLASTSTSTSPSMVPALPTTSTLPLASPPTSAYTTVSSPVPSSFSLESTPSLSSSVQTWSSPEMDRGTVAPLSPPSPMSSPRFLARLRPGESKPEHLEIRCSRTPSRIDSAASASTPTHRQTQVRDISLGEGSSTPWERGMISHWDVEEHMLAVPAPFSLSPVLMPGAEHVRAKDEIPLSPQEEEMFQTLCRLPTDWDEGHASVLGSVDTPEVQDIVITKRQEDESGWVKDDREEEGEDGEAPKQKSPPRRTPLRRSQRVAHLTALTSHRPATAQMRKRAPTAL